MKENPNKIGILVVNYNNLEYTKNCVQDIINQINQNFDLYIVDQNSNESGTNEYLNQIDNESITVIRNKNNIDLNRIWNHFYLTCKSEYLCFLNNDVRLTNNFTDDIIRIFDIESDVGAVIHVTNNLNFIKAEHILNYEILNPPLCQGWDFCFRREAFTKIPDSLRIFGGDDFLFGHLIKKGFKIALTYSSPIIHYKERTRIKLGNIIHQIQQEDIRNHQIQIKNDGYKQINYTMKTNKCNQYPPDGIKLTQNNNCIYTTIIGDYDNLPKLSVNKEKNWDYICFTDNKKLKSDVWKIIYVENNSNTQLENSRLSRYYKTNYYQYLSSYINLLYVDAKIKIVGNINEYLKNLNNYDIVFNKHPEANNIKEEMKRVLSGKLEKKSVVETVKKRYEEVGYKYNNGQFVGKFLLYKNNERTIKFFKEWWYEIENYSYPDQLSLNFVLKNNNTLKYSVINYNNTLSKYFNLEKRISKRLTF